MLVVRGHDERLRGIFAAQLAQDIGVLGQADIFFRLWGKGARGQRLPVAVQGNIGHGGVDGCFEVIAAAAGIAGADVDGHLHGAAVRAHHAGIDLNEIADGNGLIKADATGVDGDGALAGLLHGAGGAGLIDPLHRGAAVYLAAPVDVGGLG